MRYRIVLLLLTVCALAAITAGVLAQRPAPARADGVIVSAVAAGRFNVCAVTDAGGLKCWGFNAYGQVGDGTQDVRLAPVDVVGLESSVATVSPGYSHTCAVTGSGGVKCWGRNAFGVLGTAIAEDCPDGAGGTLDCSPVPLGVEGLESGVAAVSAGNFHSCALTTAGDVKCWGNNSVGQLGDGTTTTRHTPADVPGLTSGVAAVSAGFDHTCALTTAGGVKCWGDNIVSALGAESSETCTSPFGDPHPCSTTPLDVETLASGATALSSGGAYNCVLTQAGGVKCWGGNVGGRLGDGTFSEARRTPVDVVTEPGGPPLAGVAAVATSTLAHTCALMDTGGIKCWGSNLSGELGDGSEELGVPTPVDVCQRYNTNTEQCVALFSGIVTLDAGHGHTCASTVEGGAVCWGNNVLGQLGQGTSDGERHPSPVDVLGLGPKPAPVPTHTPTLELVQTPGATETPSTPVPAGPVALPETGAQAVSSGNWGTSALLLLSLAALAAGVVALLAKGGRT